MSETKTDPWVGVPPEEKAAYDYHVAPAIDTLNQELREAGSSRQMVPGDWLPDAIRELVDAVREQERRSASRLLPRQDREETR